MDSIGPLSAKIKTLGLLLLPVLIFSVDYHATDRDVSFCLYKLLTGHPCYGCGLLRGLSAALHGDLPSAVRLNKLNIVTIPLLGWLYVKEWSKKRKAPFREPSKML
jgi:hypothetical protein